MPASRIGIPECGDPDDECANPPGCQILRDLLDNKKGIVFKLTGKRLGKKGMETTQIKESIFDSDDNTIYWDREHRFNIGEVGLKTSRGAEPWEVLWHELLHANHVANGTYLGENSGPEEKQTIKDVNAKLNSWYRKCSADKDRKNITDRDWRDHSLTKNMK